MEVWSITEDHPASMIRLEYLLYFVFSGLFSGVDLIQSAHIQQINGALECCNTQSKEVVTAVVACILPAGRPTATMHESGLCDLLRIFASEMKVFFFIDRERNNENLPLATQTRTFAVTTAALKKTRNSFAAKIKSMSCKYAAKKAFDYDTRK